MQWHLRCTGGWRATFYTAGWSTRQRARQVPGGSGRRGTRRRSVHGSRWGL